jgi:hypothetical protein
MRLLKISIPSPRREGLSNPWNLLPSNRAGQNPDLFFPSWRISDAHRSGRGSGGVLRPVHFAQPCRFSLKLFVFDRLRRGLCDSGGKAARDVWLPSAERSFFPSGRQG